MGAGELLQKPREGPHPCAYVVAQHGDIRGSAAGQWIEDERRADVHVRALVDLLQLEEHRVQHAELLTHAVGYPPRLRASIGSPSEIQSCIPPR